MRARAFAVLLSLAVGAPLVAQQVPFPKAAASDSGALEQAMPHLARAVLARYQNADRSAYLNNAFRLHMLAGNLDSALVAIAELRKLEVATDPRFASAHYGQYQIFATARIKQASGTITFPDAFGQAFSEVYGPLTDGEAYFVDGSFRFFNPGAARAGLAQTLKRLEGQDSLALPDAVDLCRRYFLRDSYRRFRHLAFPLIDTERARRYIVDTTRIATRDGAAVAAIVVRPRTATERLPTVFSFTIYANDNNLEISVEAATHGYAGVVANTRGKRLEVDPMWPFEKDGEDATDVINWIARQPWSNAKVGMRGGSYDGFTQWAAAKHRPAALKTIVPAVAIVPGINSPEENGVFQSYHFAWVPYVANNRLLDDAALNDGARWARLDSVWYATGARYRSLDSLDGTPQPIFQRWLAHSVYDTYWQKLVPQGEEYAKINIPVLTITGYFDGAQVGALHYRNQHLRWNRKAEHYLLIGPWEHFGAQARPSPVVAGYRIDPAAQIDIGAVIYRWMDYVLKGKEKPNELVDRVNYQVMGSNEWRHASSLGTMARDTLTFWLSARLSGDKHELAPNDAGDAASVSRTVDFTDRSVKTSNYILDPLADTTLNLSNGVAYVSAPLSEERVLSGSFSALLQATINAKDMDIGVQLFALSPDGTYFQLACFIGRASQLRDPSRRQLLRPGTIEKLPIRETRMISKKLEAGTRLVLLVNVNQSPAEQLNYGSGKPVSDETIADATKPLTVQWHGGSTVRIPFEK